MRSLVLVLTRTFPEAPEALTVRPVSLYPPGDRIKTRIEGSVLIASHV